ncbi:MAG: hypothetical protein CMO64_05895 [Verrucomicrobiales bacterium]|nr:hypothetical protein [Verrucomicrobiales bacterium]
MPCRTPVNTERWPLKDGVSAPCAPEPATDAEGLLARAEPAARPVEPAGLLRAAPRAMLDARAKFCEFTPDIARPASARATPLRTPDTDARRPDTDGAIAA